MRSRIDFSTNKDYKQHTVFRKMSQIGTTQRLNKTNRIPAATDIRPLIITTQKHA